MEPPVSSAGRSSDSTSRDMTSTTPPTADSDSHNRSYSRSHIFSPFKSLPRAEEHAEEHTDGVDDVSSRLLKSLLSSSSSSSGSLSQSADTANNGTPSKSHRSARNICFVGAGYVGGPTAAVIAYQNPHIHVTVVDRDAQRIRQWNSRHLPVYEPGLQHIVRIARDGGRAFAFAVIDDTPNALVGSTPDGRGMRATEMMVPAQQPNLLFSVDVERCLGEADLVFIAVNTPTKNSGVGAGAATDLAAFEAVVHDIAQHARAGTIVVEKSTVPCRTAQLVQNILAVHRPGTHFDVLSNPEFLATGTAIQDLLHPDRVLIGFPATASGQRAANALADVYASWVPRSHIKGMNVWSAELAKVAANAMLAQRISSINSISAICEETGADIGEVTAGVASDLRIGNKFLKAGVGFGGSCLKKDVLSLVYLAESLGLGHIAEYWKHVVSINEHQLDRFSRRIVRCLNHTLIGKKITILGFAFKANTSDVRESPTLDIIRTLRAENPLEIAIFDPYCNTGTIRREIETIMTRDRHDHAGTDAGGCCSPAVVVYSDIYEACAASNAILIMTECNEFRNTDYAFDPFESKFDLKPFAEHKPTETDIFYLHDFISRQTPSWSSWYKGTDLLGRYMKEPSCAEVCAECKLTKRRGENIAGRPVEEIVDWRKISHHMKKPKWVFDGKGIIDPKRMALLDIQVESIGRPGKL
ncbi:hypothetical protein F5Y01DRAFT_306028 [Xylaria sp. FL0043]|nr:hypothetical protein F5Y01DRAFT_306028 [Xylaria sp. FL0043]